MNVVLGWQQMLYNILTDWQNILSLHQRIFGGCPVPFLKGFYVQLGVDARTSTFFFYLLQET
jgi:hypothetical protein